MAWQVPGTPCYRSHARGTAAPYPTRLPDKDKPCSRGALARVRAPKARGGPWYPSALGLLLAPGRALARWWPCRAPCSPVPGAPLPAGGCHRAILCVPLGAADGALRLARPPRPCQPSHGGFPLHRLRHRRPPMAVRPPQTWWAPLQAFGLGHGRWRVGHWRCHAANLIGRRTGPHHGSLFAALTRHGTPVNAAVGGPVNAAPGYASACRPQGWTALGCPRLVLGCQANQANIVYISAELSRLCLILVSA